MRTYLKTTFFLLIAVLFSFIFHEFGHWIIGEILGNKMAMSLNGTHPISGNYAHAWNRIFVLIGGPLFTLIQALVFLFLIKKFRNNLLYPFLFFPFIMRFVSSLFSIIQPQDEAIIGTLLNIGKWTLPIIITLILFYLCWTGSKVLKISWKLNLINFVFSLIFMVFVITIDKAIF